MYKLSIYVNDRMAGNETFTALCLLNMAPKQLHTHDKTRSLIDVFLCGQRAVHFESGAWVKVGIQTILMISMFAYLDMGKIFYFLILKS